MKPTDATRASQGAEAARWFMRFDSGGEPATDAALAAWLAEQPAHERAMQRVELAVELARRLAADSNSALCAEAVRAASRRRRRVSLMAPLAWGSAVAAGVSLAISIARDELPPAVAPQPAALQAARLVSVNAPSNPVVVLPNGVVVAASAVAVLPFAASGDSTLAQGIERDLIVALRSVPGLYVVGNATAQAYAGTELSLAEIGAQLGARGIVEAVVDLAEGRVRVSARLREAATGATLWQADVDRSVDEVHHVRDEIAERIATAMLDPGLQANARADSATATLAAISYSRP